jgi:DNA-binding Lrp family transcriptional regulator
MDKTDLTLCLLLLSNSRLPYSDLASKLGLSVNAVHKRVQALKESGVIHAFTAKISLSALETSDILIFGNSEASPKEEIYKKLQANDSTFWVGVAGGNYLYVGAYLRNISQLEPYVAFTKNEAKMPNPTVGIIVNPKKPASNFEKSLHKLDYEIINSLRKDSRKVIPDIAEELCVSAKTVRRRLSRMIHEDLIDLSMEWYPDKSNDIITMIHLGLKASTDKSEASDVLTRYFPNAMFRWLFSNLPNLILVFVWTNSMKELQDICTRLQGEESFDTVVPHVLYTGYMSDTWRDKLVIERGMPTAQKTR